MSGWTQVYIKGLAESTDPADEQLEELLDDRYGLSRQQELSWAGPGSTIVKRTDQGVCRGYAFLSFFSAEGAAQAVQIITNCHFKNETTSPTGSGKEPEKELENDKGTRSQPDPPTSNVSTDTSLQQSSVVLLLPLQLHAELCKPKTKSKKKKKPSQQGGQDYRDLRIRRQRGAPIRKHPVITSSDGKRTCLGNKTK